MLEAFIKLTGATKQGDCIVVPYKGDSKRTRPILVVKSQGVSKVTTLARFICTAVHGDPTDSSLHAAHSCHNNACINPDHIRWKTGPENQAENPKSRESEGYKIYKTVKNGHEGWYVRFKHEGKRYNSGFLSYKHTAVAYRDRLFESLGIPIPS